MNYSYWNARGTSGCSWYANNPDPSSRACGSFYVGPRRFPIKSINDLNCLVEKSEQVVQHDKANMAWIEAMGVSRWHEKFHAFFSLPVEEFYLGNSPVHEITRKQKEIKTIVESCLSADLINYLNTTEVRDRWSEEIQKMDSAINNFTHSFKIKDKIRKWVRGKSKHKTIEDLTNTIKVLHLEASMAK